MKTMTARSSQVLWIAITIGFALTILLATPQTASAQGPWLASPSPTPTNNIYYNAGNVGIGTNAPDQKLVVSANSATILPASAGILQLFGANGVQPVAAVDGFAAAPVYLLRRANNTAASPSAVQANDLMGAFGVAGYGSSAYQGTRARVGFFASENWTNSANGTYMAFNTTANGAAAAGGTERMRIDNAGNVGIGTTTPATSLHVVGSATFSNNLAINGATLKSWSAGKALQGTTGAFFLGSVGDIHMISNAYDPASWKYMGAGTAANMYMYQGDTVFRNAASGSADANLTWTDRMIIKANGNVGIGLSSPAYTLDVNGPIHSSNTGFIFPNGSVQTAAATMTGVTAGAGLTGGGTSGTATIDIGQGTGVTVAADSISVNYGSAPGTAVQGNTAITVSGDGISGGQPLPLGGGGTLTVNNIDRGSAQAIFKTIATDTTQFSAQSNTEILHFAGSGGTTVTLDGANKKVTIDATGSTGSAANIAAGTFGQNTGNGNYTFPGNVTVNGNINAKYQDMAEWVPSSEQLPTGTVVVLDTTKSNQVISSTQAYDTRVAGVVSEQPGIALGESGQGKVLVATTGRVLVKVDATNGPIHIGDLLVTSDIPGLAMKSEPIVIGNRKFHTPGTLIGKALEPLEKGSGRILVLLSLQ
ncbi:MAG: hypothetical protein QOG23_3925 [Blastocatellia bacterium]|jgi:hypothetical protein|nr:hypothetical protein [Blastocatellia bacterium]